MLLLTQTCQNTHGPRDKGQTLSWKVTCCSVPSISGFIEANYSSQFHIFPNGEFWKSNFHHTKARVKTERWGEVKLLSRVRLCDPVDCNLLGFSVHGILQARILEWIAISFSRGSSRPRDQTRVSHIGGRHFNLWATREALHDLKKENLVHSCEKVILPAKHSLLILNTHFT